MDTTYGAAVSIETSALDNNVLVQVPWTGNIEGSSGGHSGVFKPGVASVISPANSMTIRWSKGSGFYAVKLCREAVATRLSTLLGIE